MNVSIIADLEARASLAGLFDCSAEKLDRRIAKWERLVATTPEDLLREALDDDEFFDTLLLGPAFDA